MKTILAIAAMALAAAACTPEAEDAVETPAGAESTALPDPMVARADYANDKLWLCRPDLQTDACDVDLTATEISADGSMKEEAFQAASDPAIDCFFVYPTVSLDPGYLSDWTPDEMETDDIRLQFARFASVCRTYAPLYRQFSLTALRAASSGIAPTGERPSAGVGGLQDVSDAFNWYMENENNGRGFVLIGHSQGSGVLRSLIQNEIDGKEIESQMVSAILLGTAVMVPAGADVGGNLKSVPLCRAENQTGCVITYATFRDSNPPPEGTRFGLANEGMVAGCTNPADLSGNSLANTTPYFLTKGFLNNSGGDTQPDWVTPPQAINTPFVKTPGLISTQCVDDGTYSYLSMHVNGNPADPRTDEVGGEVTRATGQDLTWGLHLIDMDIAMGDLLRIAAAQTKTYCAAHSCAGAAH